MFDRRKFLKTSLLTTSGITGLSLLGCGGGDLVIDSEINDQVTLVTTGTAVATSPGPRLFDDFKDSKAYKDDAYQTFTNALNLDESVKIPGLSKTVSTDGTSSMMTPQGVCFAGDYILISAYDNDSSKINSVIYVISNMTPKTRELLTVLSLPTKAHVGGLAYDGENIWVCSKKTVNEKDIHEMGVIKYKTIQSLSGNLAASQKVEFCTTCPILTTASFATFYNDRVFVGKFNEDDVDKMYGYSIISKSTDKPELDLDLDKVIKMEVPAQTQGVAFGSDGLMIASTSFGRNNDAHLRFYRPDWLNPGAGNFVFKRDAFKVLTIPTMSEGVVMNGPYTYVLFESASRAYYVPKSSYDDSKNPVDRVLAFKTQDIAG